ncbi:hypothetical protein D3C87_1840770 [compost metagenome]
MGIGKLRMAGSSEPPKLRRAPDAAGFRPGMCKTFLRQPNELLACRLTGYRQTLAKCRGRLRPMQLQRQQDPFGR